MLMHTFFVAETPCRIDYHSMSNELGDMLCPAGFDLMYWQEVVRKDRIYLDETQNGIVFEDLTFEEPRRLLKRQRVEEEQESPAKRQRVSEEPVPVPTLMPSPSPAPASTPTTPRATRRRKSPSASPPEATRKSARAPKPIIRAEPLPPIPTGVAKRAIGRQQIRKPDAKSKLLLKAKQELLEADAIADQPASPSPAQAKVATPAKESPLRVVTVPEDDLAGSSGSETAVSPISEGRHLSLDSNVTVVSPPSPPKSEKRKRDDDDEEAVEEEAVAGVVEVAETSLPVARVTRGRGRASKALAAKKGNAAPPAPSSTVPDAGKPRVKRRKTT